MEREKEWAFCPAGRRSETYWQSYIVEQFGRQEYKSFILIGMIIENIVAQMLRASGHELFFFGNSDNKNADFQKQDYKQAQCITDRSEIVKKLHNNISQEMDF